MSKAGSTPRQSLICIRWSYVMKVCLHVLWWSRYNLHCWNNYCLIYWKLHPIQNYDYKLKSEPWVSVEFPINYFAKFGKQEKQLYKMVFNGTSVRFISHKYSLKYILTYCLKTAGFKACIRMLKMFIPCIKIIGLMIFFIHLFISRKTSQDRTFRLTSLAVWLISCCVLVVGYWSISLKLDVAWNIVIFEIVMKYNICFMYINLSKSLNFFRVSLLSIFFY